MNNTENIIEIEHLSKHFGDVKAVDDLSLKVKAGELYAFLGVNGAGKSTTISIICGTLEKTSGSVKVCGADENDLESAKRELGVVFQSSVLDKALSVRDNLKFRASLYGITGEKFEIRLKELDDMLHFSEFINRPVGKLSGGQRRKIDVARALIHNPKLLILDEPTTGLDPMTRKTLWEVIYSLQKNTGMTVFLTTHYMEEAAEADYVVIIDHGKISAEGTPLELKNKYTGDFITLYTSDENAVKSLGKPYEAVQDGFRIAVKNTAEATALIVARPELFSDYEIIKGKMDDVFIAVTGKKTEVR
ncbi:MAG: ABC transporter ATP-binding protein [Firmicutes bacterium]|nr:ABC transporter ATP-binding protein [Bacillota bacterium]MDY5531962.1 ABC transporter ATP-binding protein [Pumilibacteraceae bacterium]